MALTKTPIELSSTPSIVDGGNATAITIDSSENVLVGKTSAGGVATVGAELRGSAGYVISTASSDKSGWFGRNTTDGDIVGFYKDGSTVGSIGAFNGVPYIGYAGGAGGGIMFNGASIEPTALGSTRTDGTNDIGSSGYRWKDLYLSGGAYLGGTAAANKLDDFEEGVFGTSFTPSSSGSITLSGTYNNMYYTKIGRVVHVNGFFVVASVSSPQGVLKVSLPFVNKTHASNSSVAHAFMNVMSGGTVGEIMGIIDTNSSTANFYYGSSSSVTGTVANNVVASTDMRFSASYITDL